MVRPGFAALTAARRSIRLSPGPVASWSNATRNGQMVRSVGGKVRFVLNSSYAFLCALNLFAVLLGTMALVGGAFSWSTLILTIANLFISFCIVRLAVKKYKT